MTPEARGDERREREGPFVVIEGRCTDCRYVEEKRYAVQGDSGHDVFCAHPSFQPRRYIADTRWRTPEWCPLLDAAIVAALEDRGPAQGVSDG